MVEHGRRDITTSWQPFLVIRGADFSHSVECANPFTTELPDGPTRGLLEVHPSGHFIAARCAASDPWGVYVIAGEGTFAMCPNIAWTGARAPWGLVPDIESAALGSVIACSKTDFATAVTAVERVGGSAALGRFLAVMLRDDFGTHGDPNAQRAAYAIFRSALGRISATDRDALLASVRELLVTGTTTGGASLAATTLDLTDPAVTPAMILAGFEQCAASSYDDGCNALVRRYATIAPRDAARRICALASTTSDFNLGPLRIGVLAQVGDRCEPWAVRHESTGCNQLVGGRDCPSSAGPRPCTIDDYRAEIAAELSVPPGGSFPDPGFGHAARMVTAAARAMGIGCVADPLGPIGPNAPEAESRTEAPPPKP